MISKFDHIPEDFQSCHGYSDSTAQRRDIEWMTCTNKLFIRYPPAYLSARYSFHWSLLSPGEPWSLLCSNQSEPQSYGYAHIVAHFSIYLAACCHGCMCSWSLAPWRLKPLGRVHMRGVSQGGGMAWVCSGLGKDDHQPLHNQSSG